MAGKPVSVPIAKPVPFRRTGEEDVGASVVRVVNAFHPDVGNEDVRHLVVGDLTQQAVDAATLPGVAVGEEVVVGAELWIGVVRNQQGLPIARVRRVSRDIGFGRPNRTDHVHVRTSEQLVQHGVARTAAPNVDGQVIVDIDGVPVLAHSEKEDATPTWKKTYGHHPLMAFVDHGRGGTGEPVAGLLRPGRAGSNTAADHIETTRMALAQLPSKFRRGRRTLIRPTPPAAPIRSSTGSPRAAGGCRTQSA